MKKVLILNFVDFITKTEDIAVIEELIGGMYTIFRGQPVEGNLIPSIVRDLEDFDTIEKEIYLLDQLRLMGAALLPNSILETLDLIVLAQHYGLMTRLLDWTSNPLAALWFACSENLNSDAEYIYVYALSTIDLLDKDVYKNDPFASNEGSFQPIVFQPRLNNPRIIAQDGWFTLHRYNTAAKRFVPLEDIPELNITEFRIPVASRNQILWALDRHGISNRTLFPDLQGLCKYLKWKYEKNYIC